MFLIYHKHLYNISSKVNNIDKTIHLWIDLKIEYIEFMIILTAVIILSP